MTSIHRSSTGRTENKVDKVRIGTGSSVDIPPNDRHESVRCTKLVLTTQYDALPNMGRIKTEIPCTSVRVCLTGYRSPYNYAMAQKLSRRFESVHVPVTIFPKVTGKSRTKPYTGDKSEVLDKTFYCKIISLY